ncbi:DUF4190 domain-containing protein [Phytomonospora endophytica]|uniref:DUF4190 domain-containing protein n=1 Tax=Phytomonospora endophytica TaxID=714109 RepID=A0A841FY70_9ACTN|nr:DUF4190 domain-containing protein [Phytomonospora endophytica]MBB6037399.1 hypothetical protein [Phytomonospora endophytica]GIG69859.1 hypothetical protein Pen01_61540 [Phytomonospora endophytica]
MTDSPDRRDEQPPQPSSYPFAAPEERPEAQAARRSFEPGSPEWLAAKRAREEDFDALAEPRTDGFVPETAPVTAVPGPEIFGGPPPPARPRQDPLLPPVPPVKQPMGAPTPVPPRIGRPTMPYGYTGRIAPGSAGGGYQLMLPQIKPIHSGPAIGGVLAGSAGILAAIAVGCVGIMFDTVFGVAFTVLAVFLCGASLALAVVGMRQVKASGGEYTGRGTAITGMVLGGVGFLLTVMMILAVAAFSDEPGQSDNPPIGPSPTSSESPRGR